jgi:hypothetical protein
MAPRREITLKEILPRKRVLTVDVESVDDPSDYAKLLEKLSRICPDGELRYDHATCERRAKSRILTLTRGRRKLSVELDDRGVVDPRFLKWVDGVVLGPRSSHRLVMIHSDDQCFRPAFASAAERKALADASLLDELPDTVAAKHDEQAREELAAGFASLRDMFQDLRKR